AQVDGENGERSRGHGKAPWGSGKWDSEHPQSTRSPRLAWILSARDRHGRPTMSDNAVRGPFNPWLLEVLDGYMHGKYGPLKSELFGAIPPTVVDLGAGSGANFRYFPPGTHVVAVEPNAQMHPRLLRNAARRGLTLQL